MREPPVIVGISGMAGSGKDTAADFLVKNSGFVKIAFADEIKRTVKRIYPRIPVENLWGSSDLRNAPLDTYPREHGPFHEGLCMCCGKSPVSTDKCFLTVRFAAQWLGTEWGRTCYRDTWIEITMRAVESVLYDGVQYDQERGLVFYEDERAPPPGVVIPDLRWPTENEGLSIQEAGGILLRMKRGAGLNGAAGKHASELSMQGVSDDFFDAIADNVEWELGELEDFMQKLADYWLKRKKEEAAQ